MRRSSESPKPPATLYRGERIATVLIGLLLAGVAIVIAWQADTPGAWLAALVFGALGLEAIIGAARARRSWLMRIGPLP